MKINKGALSEGADADIAIIDPEKAVTLDSSQFLSKGKNSPFNKWQMKGTVEKTIVKGKIFDWT
jgi:dihydroorotase